MGKVKENVKMRRASVANTLAFMILGCMKEFLC